MDSFSNSLIISRSVQEILEVSGHVVHVTFRVLRRFEGSVDVKEPPLGCPGTQGNACSAGFCPSLGLRQLDWGAVGLKDDAMSRIIHSRALRHAVGAKGHQLGSGRNGRIVVESATVTGADILHDDPAFIARVGGRTEDFCIFSA